MADSADTGGRKPGVADEDILDVFRATSDPVLSTSEVAEEFSIHKNEIVTRLRILKDQGDLEGKQVSEGTTVWWLPIVGTTPTREIDEGLPMREDDVTRMTVDTLDESVYRSVDIEAALDEIDTPGSGQEAEKREQALREAYEYLIDNGSATRGDFKNLLGNDVGFTGGFSSWWISYINARDALASLPGVEPPAEGEDIWQYVEP